MGRDSGFLALAWLAAALAAGCGGDDFQAGDSGIGDTDTDTDSDTGSDAGTDSDVDTDTDSDTDADTDEAGPAEPCWKESFGDDHPNVGLPDCEAGYVCLGDATGAWCTEACDETGEVDSSTSPFNGWCCAEFSDPCDPSLFWMPEQLDVMCVPRTALAAEPCTQEGVWPPSTAARCMPICDGTDLVSETVCQAASETEFFCTFACTDALECETLDDTIGNGFTGGCCQPWGASDLCTPTGLCV